MNSARTLDAAGITDPQLRQDYEKCRELFAEHGKTYYLSTLLLPPAKRPDVWALYGFARYADDFVDSLTAPDPQALIDWGNTFLAGLATSQVSDPVSRAMIRTMRQWSIPKALIEAFLESMRMDITITGYATYADLERYMYGSAAVIGLQMLPILEPLTPEAGPRARALGEAFQLTNFIRDVGEDLQRGRVYLPEDDLAVFGVDREMLAAGVVTTPVRELLRFEIERARGLYTFAEPGIDMLHPTSRDCVRTAWTLYQEILTAVEEAHYQVLSRRICVSWQRKLTAALPAMWQARATRRDQQHWTTIQSPKSTTDH